MSKRYYTCRVVGNGDADAPFPYTPTTGPYRAIVADFNVNHVAEIETHPTTGVPTKNWCLTMVNARNQGLLRNHPDIDALPDFPLDGKVNSIETGARNKMQTDLQRRGVDTSHINNSDGYRDVIRGIGRQLNPNFDENNFDVSE